MNEAEQVPQAELSQAPPEQAAQAAPEVAAPVQQVAPKPKARFPIWIIIVAIVFVLAVVGLALVARGASPEVSQATPTPTKGPAVTPTTTQKLSIIATSSAFMSFSEAVASLSATLTAFSLDDGALSPPSLETPINFGSQSEQ